MGRRHLPRRGDDRRAQARERKARDLGEWPGHPCKGAQPFRDEVGIPEHPVLIRVNCFAKWVWGAFIMLNPYSMDVLGDFLATLPGIPFIGTNTPLGTRPINSISHPSRISCAGSA